MASKKSKVLAIAFCAAVMSGIYVNPVLAAERPVNNGSVTVGYKDFETTTGYEEDAQVTITNIASQKDLEATQQAVSDLEVKNDKQDSAIAGLDALLKEEEEAREKADAAHNQAISDLEVKNDKQDSAIAGLDALLKEEEEAREKADADLQDQIDGHTNQIDSMGDQLDDLKANDEKQDGTLADHQEQLDDHSQQLDAVRGEISEEHRVNFEQQEQLDDHSQQLDAVRGEISEEHRVNGEQNEILADHQEQLDDHSQQLDEVRGEISSEIRDRTEADEKLQQSIDIQREVIGAGSTDELKGAYSGTNYIKDANNMAEADVILDREISNVNSRVDGIENRVDGLEDRIDKVGAMSAAIANLRTMGYDPAAPTEVAVGVGQYRDETGMALGLFHYPNRDFMLSLSVSTSGDEYMGGIGATWKFGRKSPEKVAEIKKAQAEADARRAEEQKLAKAEEMKKAAKEAKVQAQMERHAKMLAEQEAQA